MQAVMHKLLTLCAKISEESCSQKPGSKELDAKIALQSLFYENGNTAAFSSFALLIDDSMKFARQIPLQSYKARHRLKFWRKLLDNVYESTEKLVAGILAVAKKYGAAMAC